MNPGYPRRLDVTEDGFARGHVGQPALVRLGNHGKCPVNSNFPFLDSQWDGIEGVNDQIQVLNEDDDDPIVRVPNLIFTIGFHGYRIIQQPGAGPH